MLNHRQQKRALALALQIYNAGDWYPLRLWGSGVYAKTDTPESCYAHYTKANKNAKVDK